MSMTPEAWDFPRFHGVKAIGLSTSNIHKIFISLVKSLQLRFKDDKISSKKSKNGQYLSVTIEVFFHNAQEVKQLYSKLHEHPDIIQSL